MSVYWYKRKTSEFRCIVRISTCDHWVVGVSEAQVHIHITVQLWHCCHIIHPLAVLNSWRIIDWLNNAEKYWSMKILLIFSALMPSFSDSELARRPTDRKLAGVCEWNRDDALYHSCSGKWENGHYILHLQCRPDSKFCSQSNEPHYLSFATPLLVPCSRFRGFCHTVRW
jgi:hypothetical protein